QSKPEFIKDFEQNRTFSGKKRRVSCRFARMRPADRREWRRLKRSWDAVTLPEKSIRTNSSGGYLRFERAETPHNLPSSVRVVPAFKPRAARNAPARGQSRRPTFSRECIDWNRADGGRALAAQRNSYTRKLPRSSAFVVGFVITGA